MWGTWRTSGILIVWVQDATSIWWDTANHVALSALWRLMLPLMNLTNLLSLILLHHPVQCPLHESNWNNLSFSYTLSPGSSQLSPCPTLVILRHTVSPTSSVTPSLQRWPTLLYVSLSICTPLQSLLHTAVSSNTMQPPEGRGVHSPALAHHSARHIGQSWQILIENLCEWMTEVPNSQRGVQPCV